MPVILAIEDNDGDSVILEQALEEVAPGIDYRVVTSGALAMRYLDRRDMYQDAPRPDLIILDLNMPVMNGFDFLRQMRAQGRWHAIPVVVLTSSRREHDHQEVLSLGASHLEVKPDKFDQSLKLAQRLRDLAYQTAGSSSDDLKGSV